MNLGGLNVRDVLTKPLLISVEIDDGRPIIAFDDADKAAKDLIWLQDTNRIDVGPDDRIR